MTLQCNTCFIGFEVAVVRCSVATTDESETNRIRTVDCWHGGGSSRSKLDIYIYICIHICALEITKCVFSKTTGFECKKDMSNHTYRLEGPNQRIRLQVVCLYRNSFRSHMRWDLSKIVRRASLSNIRGNVLINSV